MLRQRGIAFHTFRPQNSPKCAELVWCELNMNIEGFFRQFFPEKKLYIFYLASPDD